jgi:hypothetical protein
MKALTRSIKALVLSLYSNIMVVFSYGFRRRPLTLGAANPVGRWAG